MLGFLRKKNRWQCGPIQIHLETFQPAFEGTNIGQILCVGMVEVSAPDSEGATVRKSVHCHNHAVTIHALANGNPNLLMTVCLDETSPVAESLVVAMLYKDGHVEGLRLVGSGEHKRLSLDELIMPTTVTEPKYFATIGKFCLPGNLNRFIRGIRDS